MGHSFDRVQTVSEKNWHNHERGSLRVVDGSVHQSDKIRLCGSIGSFYKRNAGWLHSGGGGHRWPELSLQGSCLLLLLDRIPYNWLFIICNNNSRSSSNCNCNRDSNSSSGGGGGCNNH